ncbi:MerR family transcriptional regulator [Homoserinibacter sp. YIM 151385]|uniref:MerR family transcriptional regulator n=1 Tax=Homoserinibacter sp. YIM 151385 TaxID=2985506 RepID=UPI0022F05DC7|nr:MerR family transcriptional regulator [Homoserinibacter sp. YIM 151385]WBU37405.1 MerR family transcriptional regulator [Homoserinibacter sp. YIM 151385]
MDRSIQEIARIAGTTSRTLRHYGELGLLVPSRISSGGMRHYDAEALVRLQRILLLRELGVGLPEIARILDGAREDVPALRTHLAQLGREQERLARQIAAVERTIEQMEKGVEPMAEEMFEGFDHAQHRAEVQERWGEEAAARGDAWWRGMTEVEQRDWQARVAELSTAWREAAARGVDPAGEEAQALAARHAAWLRAVPGTPGDGGADREGFAAYLMGLGEMYVADPRFAANYGGQPGARLVRDALAVHVERELG